MNGKCIEIGLIQAFLDGETSPGTSLSISEHISGCAKCAKALADAEEESSFVFAVLEREINTLVPTQRLWSRINESIAVEQRNTSIWQRIYSIFAGQFANPSFAVAAGVLLVVGMVAVVWMTRSDVTQTGDITFVSQPPVIESPGTSAAPEVTSPTNVSDPTSAALDPVAPIRAKADPLKRTTTTETANFNAKQNQPRYENLRYEPQYMPAEASYQKTIADLKQNVDSQKDRLLSPSERVAFERDLAVLNDAIKKMKTVVRKNPKNQAARQVLYSSYQDKIDLLNSVGQREELMAGFN